MCGQSSFLSSKRRPGTDWGRRAGKLSGCMSIEMSPFSCRSASAFGSQPGSAAFSQPDSGGGAYRHESSEQQAAAASSLAFAGSAAPQQAPGAFSGDAFGLSMLSRASPEGVTAAQQSLWGAPPAASAPAAPLQQPSTAQQQQYAQQRSSSLGGSLGGSLASTLAAAGLPERQSSFGGGSSHPGSLAPPSLAGSFGAGSASGGFTASGSFPSSFPSSLPGSAAATGPCFSAGAPSFVPSASSFQDAQAAGASYMQAQLAQPDIARALAQQQALLSGGGFCGAFRGGGSAQQQQPAQQQQLRQGIGGGVGSGLQLNGAGGGGILRGGGGGGSGGVAGGGGSGGVAGGGGFGSASAFSSFADSLPQLQRQQEQQGGFNQAGQRQPAQMLEQLDMSPSGLLSHDLMGQIGAGPVLSSAFTQQGHRMF